MDQLAELQRQLKQMVSSQNRRLVYMMNNIYFCEWILNYRKMKEEKDRLMEGLLMLYQTEGVPRNISIEQFCMNNDNDI